MTHPSCDQPEERIADDMADDVLALAAKYYAEQQASFSESELIAAGSEVSIPPELINKAIAEIAYQKQQATLAAQVLKENRRLFVWTCRWNARYDWRFADAVLQHLNVCRRPC